MKLFRIIALVGAGLLLGRVGRAQITPNQIVQASVGIVDQNGTILPGSNPFGPSPIPGCLVQILDAGANAAFDLPNLDGTPSGDDAVLFTTQIGQGIPTNMPVSGQFSTAFTHPTDGTKIYCRVFNGTNVTAASYWGQSGLFTVNGPAVFDVSVAGLKATTMPKGHDLLTTLDNKGQSYYSDLIANINPLDLTDLLQTSGLSGTNNRVSLTGHVGRFYTLQRSLDLTVSNGWTNLVSTGILTTNQDSSTVILTDTNPPAKPKAFYRVKISMP